MHGVAHQHRQRQQREQGGTRLHDKARTAVRRVRQLPGGKAEGERRDAVAG